MTAGGAVTLLFTDIQGSTQLLARLGERYADLLEQHHRLMRSAIKLSAGREVDNAGDSFFAVFESASQAVQCARVAQEMLAAQQWPSGEPLLVRIGVHTGTPTVRDGRYVGIDVHRAARVMALAHGGQVLVTDDVRRALDEQVELRDLGHHRLKDLSQPERLFQLVVPGLGQQFPALRSLNRSNLPTPAQSLVGRRDEVASALAMLGRENVRLLTLLGPGGAGKTRLAIEVAALAVRRWRDGVWIVPLAPILDPALMVSELARVLEIEPVLGEPLDRTLIAALADRELLLVLDNFEHLMPAAEMVAELLAGAPRVVVLCTSREPLRIRVEHRMDVPPLPVEAASELFVERAYAVRAGLTLDDADRVAIERICARLDGLPLAIELAAARAAVFAPAALEARIAERLALPEGPRDLPERQRTLRATIDWSYQLLQPAERALMKSLSTFIGGVRIDSAESIWDSDSIDALISLADKSLLRRREDPDGEPRFWMLETVREFAAEQAMAEGTAAASAASHAAHLMTLVEEAEPNLVASDQRRWLDRIEADYANLRAALDHLMAVAPERALRMAGILTWFWDVRGYLPEGRQRLLDVLAVAPDEGPDRARALWGAGRILLLLGDTAKAPPMLREAAALAKAAGDARMAINALSNLGWALQAGGNRAQSIAVSEEAISLARSAGDDWALAVALNNHGDMFFSEGEFARARPLFEESLVVRRRSAEPRGIAVSASNLAQAVLGDGELNAAEALVQEALRHGRAIDYSALIATALATGTMIALQREDMNLAEERLATAAEQMPTSPEPELVALVLSASAPLAAVRHEPLLAASLWAAADQVRAHLNRVETPAAAVLRARWLPEARAAALTGESWDAAWAAGGELSLEEALALAQPSALNPSSSARA